MDINSRVYRFLREIGEPVNSEFVEEYYETYNLKYEKVDLYRDYILSLFDIVIETYLGDDITNEIQRVKHFKWCWDKNVDNFKKEGIILDSNDLYEYFKIFFIDIYYDINNKESEELEINIRMLWLLLFNYREKKTVPDLEILTQIYRLFENSIKK